MDIKLRIKSIIRTFINLTILLLLVSGYSQASDATDTKRGAAVTRSSILNSAELPKSNIQKEIAVPEKLRKSGRVLDRATMPKVDRNLGRSAAKLDASGQPDDCICICTPDGCEPADCVHCPVPLCPGGYMPPCEDGEIPRIDLENITDPRVVTPKNMDQRVIFPRGKMPTQ